MQDVKLGVSARDHVHQDGEKNKDKWMAGVGGGKNRNSRAAGSEVPVKHAAAENAHA